MKKTPGLSTFQFSLRAMFAAVAIIAAAVAIRHELHWFVWAGLIVYCLWLSLKNISYDVRNRPL